MVFMFVFEFTIESMRKNVLKIGTLSSATCHFKSDDLGNLRYILLHSSLCFYFHVVSARCLLQG